MVELIEAVYSLDNATFLICARRLRHIPAESHRLGIALKVSPEIHLYRSYKTGEWQTRTHLRGRKSALSQEQKQSIIQLVQEQPNITINEIIEQLHLTVSDETVRHALIKAGYTYKKKSLHAKEQERPRCQEQKDEHAVIIMDNMRSHHAKVVKALLEERKVDYLYLTPYSPDLNPIEKLWSKLKSILRTLKVRAFEKLPSAVAQAFRSICTEDCKGWFRSCGLCVK